VPSAHYASLKKLFAFLRAVADRSSVNKMTPQNLAIVWAPNLIRPKDLNPFVTLRDLKFVTDTTMWLIEQYHTVFSEDF
jgi:RhoGAP domain